MKRILSIQSSVAYGHVGNSAATFPLMRMGVEVWPVITVHFSNNTGYASWRGPLLSADDVRDVVRGIDELGVLGECDAVLSGYQGADDSGTAILEAVALVKERNPAAVYCCDPVLGDVTIPGFPLKFSSRPDLPDLTTAALGQHNTDVLGTWAGYDQARIDELARSGLLHERDRD